MKRGVKKFVYGLLYFSVLSLVVFLVWRSATKVLPTCEDGIQNQQETGVDCGGPCVLCEIKNLSPLETLSPNRIIGLSGGGTMLLFQVHNPNSTYHATSFTYHVSVFDKGGIQIEEFNGQNSLFAGESKYIIEPHVLAHANNIGEVQVSFDNPQWRSSTELVAPILSVSDIKTEVSPEGSVRVYGVAKNSSGLTADDVSIIAIVYNSYGTSVFAASNILTSLSGFKSTEFTIPFPTDPAFINVDKTRTQVFISSK